MSFTELKCFDAVARHGSFVKAAEKLGRTQPTVTMQVSQLEKAFGVELVVRGRGKMIGLTRLGESLFSITRHLLALEQDAVSLLKGAGAMTRGQIRITSTAPSMAIKIVERFSRRHPLIDVNLHFANSETVLQSVLSCETDVGILGGHADHPDCLAVQIAKPEIVLIGHRDHPAVVKGTIDREEFARETLLIREQGSETRDLLLSSMRQHDYRPARLFEIGSRDGAIAAAIARMGLAPISEYEMVTNDQLGLIRFAGFKVFGVNHAVCLKKRADSNMIAAVLQAARAFPDCGSAADCDPCAAPVELDGSKSLAF